MTIYVLLFKGVAIWTPIDYEGAYQMIVKGNGIILLSNLSLCTFELIYLYDK